MINIDIKNPTTQLFGIIIAAAAMIGYFLLQLNSSNALFAYAQVPPNGDNNGNPIVETSLQLSNDDHLYGDPNAQIIVYEFSDFECPFCERNHPTLKSLVDNNDGNVAWVYKHFPLSSHIHAQEKAEASECVAELGGNDAFWTFTDILFESGTQTALTKLPDFAEEAGVNRSDFESCVDSGRHEETVLTQFNQGVAAGVQGTPGNVVVDTVTGTQQLIPGALPLDQFQTVIDGMLQ